MKKETTSVEIETVPVEVVGKSSFIPQNHIGRPKKAVLLTNTRAAYLRVNLAGNEPYVFHSLRSPWLVKPL